ncbi:MAG: hypothetical protein L3J54_05020 [Draconibacterium sp.]|nr:hypothetical protein [Draconibacterium sp.]
MGRTDYTSIWFFQKVGLEIRVIDFYENNMEDLPHYAELIRSKPYSYGTHFLPHDSSHNRLGMKGSIKTQLKTMGIDSKMLPPLNDKAGIALGRTMLGECYISSEKCKDGLHALNHFQYEYDSNKKTFKEKPISDWSNHASDAWKYMCLAIANERPKAKPASLMSYSSKKWIG